MPPQPHPFKESQAILLCCVLASLMLIALFGTLQTEVATASSTSQTFTVNSSQDQVDANPGNGICRTAASTCTLRAAIQEANTTPISDTILLPGGTYHLSIAGRDEDNAATGDLDILQDLLIAGTGHTAAIIDANILDRVLHIPHADTQVTLKGITIQDGYPGDTENGGGIYNSGQLLLHTTIITDNRTNGFRAHGGGIFNNGQLTLYQSQVAGNRANGQEAMGGAFLMVPA